MVNRPARVFEAQVTAVGIELPRPDETRSIEVEQDFGVGGLVTRIIERNCLPAEEIAYREIFPRQRHRIPAYWRTLRGT